MDNIENLLNQAEDKLSELQVQKEREAVFAVEANTRFDKNIKIFQQYFPDIFKTLDEFKPREDFCLHVTKSGAANFYPSGRSVPLYGDDPIQQATEQLDKNLASPSFSRTDYFSAPNTLKEDPRLHIKYIKQLADLLGQVKSDDLDILTKLPDSYPTCMMFGIGLGYHIELLLAKHKFDYMFICEPDIELFFASLFCIDWASIIEEIDRQGGCLFINVGSTFEEFFEDIRLIAEKVGANSIINSFCYQHYPSEQLNLSIKEFFDKYYQLHQGFGFYNDAITGLAHSIISTQAGYPQLFSAPEKREKLRNKPVFVIANGPSLDSSIEFIKRHKDDVVIIAAGTALFSLLKAGVSPDFHVLVERTKGTFDAQLDFLKGDLRDYLDFNLLTVDVMYPDVLPMYKWAGFARKGPEAASVFLAAQSIINEGVQSTELPYCSPLVANTALSYATIFGFGEIYMFGIDNGYHTNNQTHSALSIYNDEQFINMGYKAESGANYVLEGNFGAQINATKLMVMSNIMIEKLIALFPSTTFYNVGNGAKIKGASVLQTDHLFLENRILNKNSIVDSIKSEFFKSSSLDNLDDAIGLNEFCELCDYLLEIGKRPYSTREEAHKILRAQQNVLLAYTDNRFAHFYHLLKGTLLYFHCPMVTLLYYYEQEKESLEWFEKVLSVWLDFISEVKSDFSLNWKTRCNWSEFY